MATTTNLVITKPETGQAQPQVTIATGFDYFDVAVAGKLSQAVTTADVTLTDAQGRNAIIECTGTLTGNRALIVPTRTKIYLVYNNTSGAFTLTVKTSGGSGIAVTQGTRVVLYCDGTNVVQLSGASLSGGAVPDYLEFTEASAPSTPASGKVRIYAKADGNFYQKDDAGTETVLAGGGSGSSIVDFKDSVRVATTGAGTLATSFENGDTIDGVVLATGNRILIKDQASGAENGIYVVAASGAPTRATDFDADAEVTGGCAIPVSEGTANGDKLFLLTTNDPITVGSTALVFAAISAGGGSTAWSALTDPAGNISLAMATHLTTLTWAGNYSTSSAFKLSGNNTSPTGPLLHLVSAASNNMPLLLAEPRGGQSLKIDHLQNLFLGKGAPGSTDTDGYPHLPIWGSNAEPSGTPTLVAGWAPIGFEQDAIQGEYRAWAYLNSAWRQIGGTPKGLYGTSTGTGAQTIDWTSSGDVATRQFTVSGNASVTFTFSNAKAGQICNLIFIRDATGSAAVNWPAAAKWPGASPYVPTTGAAKKDIFQFVYDGTNYIILGYAADIS